MHSRVFQLSDEELPEDEWMSLYHIPEWFYGSVADSAIESENREADFAWLRESMRGAAKLQGNKLTFEKDAAIKYFAGMHKAFLQKLEEIKSVSLEEFAGITGNFGVQLHFLTSLYNDEFEFYIYHNDSLMTMDEWIRYTDLTHPFFVGGIFDYHY